MEIESTGGNVGFTVTGERFDNSTEIYLELRDAEALGDSDCIERFPATYSSGTKMTATVVFPKNESDEPKTYKVWVWIWINGETLGTEITVNGTVKGVIPDTPDEPNEQRDAPDIAEIQTLQAIIQESNDPMKEEEESVSPPNEENGVPDSNEE